MYLDYQNDKVNNILRALLSDENGLVRELIMQDNTEYRNDLLDAIDKGTEGVSDAMKLLKYANRLTELVDTIVLMDSVEDEMLDYLSSVITTEDLNDAIASYKSYKTSNYVTYVLDKWVKEDVMDKAVDIIRDTVIEISGGATAHVGAVALYFI